MKYYSVLILLLVASTMFGQTTLSGKITDAETGEDLIGANIVLLQVGAYKAGASTDFDGNYSVDVEAGTYDVEVTYFGYPSKLLTDVVVKPERLNLLYVKMKVPDDVIYNQLCVCVGCGWDGYIKRLYDREDDNTINAITAEVIRNVPTKKINEIMQLAPGISTRF